MNKLEEKQDNEVLGRMKGQYVNLFEEIIERLR